MIVVDGDSVPHGVAVDVNSRWPKLLADARGREVLNLARIESTASDCVLRWNEVDRLRKPGSWWYVLQAGQWSMFRPSGEARMESPKAFEAAVREAMERALERGADVCLVTPPPQREAAMRQAVPAYLAVTRRLASVYGMALLDAHALMCEEFYYQPHKVEAWLLPQDGPWSHYSADGHAVVAGYFERPENRWICA